MERSLWYHRYTLEIYLHFYILSGLNGIELPDEVKNAIESLGEFLMYSSRPDKTFPLMGDDDGGRLLFLDNYTGNDLSYNAARQEQPGTVAQSVRQAVCRAPQPAGAAGQGHMGKVNRTASSPSPAKAGLIIATAEG